MTDDLIRLIRRIEELDSTLKLEMQARAALAVRVSHLERQLDTTHDQEDLQDS